MMEVCRAPSALDYLLALNSRNVYLIAYASRKSLTPFPWMIMTHSAFAFDISSLASLVNLFMASAY